MRRPPDHSLAVGLHLCDDAGKPAQIGRETIDQGRGGRSSSRGLELDNGGRTTGGGGVDDGARFFWFPFGLKPPKPPAARLNPTGSRLVVLQSPTFLGLVSRVFLGLFYSISLPVRVSQRTQSTSGHVWTPHQKTHGNTHAIPGAVVYLVAVSCLFTCSTSPASTLDRMWHPYMGRWDGGLPFPAGKTVRYTAARPSSGVATATLTGRGDNVSQDQANAEPSECRQRWRARDRTLFTPCDTRSLCVCLVGLGARFREHGDRFHMRKKGWGVEQTEVERSGAVRLPVVSNGAWLGAYVERLRRAGASEGYAGESCSKGDFYKLENKTEV